MKEELIKLAEKVGFNPQVRVMPTFINEDCTIDKSKLDVFIDIAHYLWLCELQKWLREKHNIIVTFEISGAGLFPDIITFDENPFKTKTINCSFPMEAFDECIEKGLFEALKLIK